MDDKISNKRDVYHRHSIRLRNYDYSRPGFYFITICTWKFSSIFGEIENDRMSLNKYGKIVENEWIKTGKIRSNIILHEFVIMPNHLHGIIEITGKICRGMAHHALFEKFSKPSSNTIPTIIRSFKAIVTKQIRELVNNTDFHVWQRNYFEHIIRNEESYLQITEYIQNNPIKWREDKYYG